FQWLYWALTITAWLCLGLLIVAVTPLFGPQGATAARTPASLGMIALCAGVGLCAALTAWLVSRVAASRDGLNSAPAQLPPAGPEGRGVAGRKPSGVNSRTNRSIPCALERAATLSRNLLAATGSLARRACSRSTR